MENKPKTNAGTEYRTFLSTVGKWVFWGSLIGVVSGSTSALLLNTNDFLTAVREANPWLVYLLPVGGVVIGYLYMYHGKDAFKGNDLILEHIQHGQGKIPLLMGPIVFVSTFITHLFGGSTGREGAAIQMGASISEGVSRLFKINPIDRRILMISGISGGFGSAFGTPLTGTIFGMEVIALGKMKFEAIVPCLTASFVGHFVSAAWGVKHEHHVIRAIPEISTVPLMKVILLSVIFGLTSALYTQLRHEVASIAKRRLKNLMLRAATGGVIIILLTLLIGSRDYLGRGLPMVEQAFTDEVPPYAFLAKIVFTAVTMGMGFRGGEVIPLFFIGSTLGNTLAPLVNLPVSFAAALGLIAVFSGAVNAPIACFILSIEFFDGEAALYFFLACMISYLCSGPHTLYGAQKVFGPKSRLFHIYDGERVTASEKRKRGEKTNK